MVAYLEFSMLADNAAEAGLPWAGAPPVERCAVEVEGGRWVSALRWGSGPTEVVLLHGGSQNAHTWDTVALALDRPLLAVDLPGHGHSGWRPAHDYTLDNMAADVAAAIDRLAPSPRLMVGMSLGGLTALALAGAAPRLVPGLVLVDITPGVTPEKTRAITDFVSGPTTFAGFDAIVERTVRHNPGRSVSSLRRGVLHNAQERADGSWAWRWDPERGGRARGDGPERLWEVVADFAGPLILARGADSPVVSDADVAELGRRKPDSRVISVAGAGHSIQGDQPLRLAEIIAAEMDAER